ncbi:MAG: ABC transporter substrate-binding protein [Fusobacteriaceae bacterium]|nr:ABC transporter substrate-binding protein [Fusobacteriaceae bacterium]
MKKLFLFLIFTLSFYTYPLTVYLPKAPPSLPMAKVAQNMKNLELVYYDDVNTEILPKIIKNEDALFIIPTNVGANLYNKGKDIKLISILSNGLISIISSKDIKNFKSLNKEDIYIGGQGSSPDVISNYLFKKNSITPIISYRESSEIAKLLITNKINTAVLPEPLASMVLEKNKKMKRIFILKNEWTKLNKQSGIPQVAIFASSKVISENSVLLKNLETNYLKTLKSINGNKKEAAKFSINLFQMNIGENAFINSINNMNLTYISNKNKNILVNTYLEAINIKVPDDKFYQK